MNILKLAAAAAFACAGVGASAATVDFTDGTFGTSNPNGFFFATITEIADGVTFTLTATSNQVGGPKWNNSDATMDNGLQVGGGSGSTLAFEMTVDTDITLDAYTLNQQTIWLGSADFDVLDGATTLSEDNTLAAGSALNQTFDNGPISMTAGTVYSFILDGTSAGVLAGIASMDFTVAAVVDPIPLPAGLPLMLAGLGAFAWVRRKA